MKASRLVVLFPVLAMASGARAGIPMSAHALGSVQATLEFCARVDPAQANTYAAFSNRMVEGASADDLNVARRSPEYRDAFETMREQLSKVEAREAAPSCRSLVGTTP